MGDNFLATKRNLPILGVGLGLRSEIAHETFANSETIDWLEFTPENYLGFGGQTRSRLEAAAAAFPLASHGVSLSVGGTDPLDMTYLRSLKELFDKFDVPWWSDHLCFTSANGKSTHDLLPLPWTREAVDHIALRARQVQEFVGRPFLLENISTYMQMPCAQMSEAQFFAEILEKADCGMLLDVNNVYVNSVNHGFDPFEYLKQLPLERVVQIHIAGHLVHNRQIIDTHGASIVEPVYQLLAEVLKRVKVNAILLERDQNFPAFSELLAELAMIRSVAEEADGTGPAPDSQPASRPAEIVPFRPRKRRSPTVPAADADGEIPLKELEGEFCDLLLDRKKQARIFGKRKGKSAPPIRPRWLRSLVDGDGVATYVWLLNSNQESLVGNLYPVCRSVLGRSWHRVVDDYFVHFPPGNLNFRDFGENLSQYFAKSGRHWTRTIPFLPALAEFEWAKILINDSPAESELTKTIAFTSREELSSFRPLVNPILLLRKFDYPVHEIARQVGGSCCQIPQVTPEETYLAIYRELPGEETRVCQVSAVGASVIARAQEGTSSYLDLVESEGEKLGEVDTNPFLVMLELLDSLRQLGILVGSEPIASEDRMAAATA